MQITSLEAGADHTTLLGASQTPGTLRGRWVEWLQTKPKYLFFLGVFGGIFLASYSISRNDIEVKVLGGATGAILSLGSGCIFANLLENGY